MVLRICADRFLLQTPLIGHSTSPASLATLAGTRRSHKNNLTHSPSNWRLLPSLDLGASRLGSHQSQSVSLPRVCRPHQDTSPAQPARSLPRTGCQSQWQGHFLRLHCLKKQQHGGASRTVSLYTSLSPSTPTPTPPTPSPPCAGTRRLPETKGR